MLGLNLPHRACALALALAWLPSRLPTVARAAEEQTRHRVVYDPSYHRLSYPGGDVPAGVGVCTDVVVRAYRAASVDLQQLVHEDMVRAFGAYPRSDRARPDANIDHRRVANLRVFLARAGAALSVSRDPATWLPGDRVTWTLSDGKAHIGVVSGRRIGTVPLVVHNIGAGPKLEDVLFAFRITGHYRYDPR